MTFNEAKELLDVGILPLVINKDFGHLSIDYITSYGLSKTNDYYSYVSSFNLFAQAQNGLDEELELASGGPVS